MYKIFFLSLFFIGIGLSLFGQKQKSPINENIIIVQAIDTVNNEIVFRKNIVKYKSDSERFIEKKFYINIPKGFSFILYRHKSQVNTCIFSNENVIIAIEILLEKYEEKKLITGKFSELDIKDNIQEQNKIKIENEMYCGFYERDNYIIYYYNAEKKDIQQLNKSIQSIRKRKKHN